MNNVKLYYATFLWCGVKTMETSFGSTLYVKADNKDEAREKIFDYIRKHYSVQSVGYKVMENPDKFNFAINTEVF